MTQAGVVPSYSTVTLLRASECMNLNVLNLKLYASGYNFQGDWCSYSAYTYLHLLMTQYMTLPQRKFMLYRNSIQHLKLLFGYMKAHHEEWFCSKKRDAHGDSVFEFAVLNNLHQLVDLPTRTGKDGECSKLDLFLTTPPGNHVVTVSAPL